MSLVTKSAAIGLALSAALGLASCATGERLAPDGVTEHQVYCGYLLPWSMCESKAADLCPTGYTTISKTWDSWTGSEMFVRCKGAVAAVTAD